MKTHAQVPTCLVLPDRLRVYFASRPRKNLSLATFVDLDPSDPTRVLFLNPEPILELGGPGAFDQHGIMPAATVRLDRTVYLYYSGWSRGVGVPYSNYTGLAVSEDEGVTFRKISPGPIVDRTPHEIYSATSPAVLRQGEEWHMWYCCGTYWHEIKGKLEHTYEIRHATSSDGIGWKRDGQRAIPQRDPFEAITRATVLPAPNCYHMWYCYRGSTDFRGGADSYRIGYAVSNDLVTWQRSDETGGLLPAESGWDSEMTAYPDVFMVNGRLHLLYNGNEFGAEGFGWATSDSLAQQ